MRTPTPLVTAAAILAMPVTTAFAQTTIPPDVRAKMSGYVGTWDYEERVKGEPSAPETVVTGTWEASWIYESLIEWRGIANSGGESTSSVEYEGYDAVMQGYTFVFNSDGTRSEAYDGEWDGDTFRIQYVAFLPDGEVSRGRCTWPYNSDFTVIRDYTCETLTDGTWWVYRRGTATKTP